MGVCVLVFLCMLPSAARPTTARVAWFAAHAYMRACVRACVVRACVRACVPGSVLCALGAVYLPSERVWVFGAGMANVGAQWNRVPGMSTPKKKQPQKRARASASGASASGATAGGASAASTKKGRKGGKGKGR